MQKRDIVDILYHTQELRVEELSDRDMKESVNDES